MKLLCAALICTCVLLKAQPVLYTLSNDSVTISANTKKTAYIFYTNKSCYDCFFYLNDYFKTDTSCHYYFVIEKTPSAVGNYEIYKKLIKRGIGKNNIYFTKANTQEISPFIKLYSDSSWIHIPYSELFEDKETMRISKKLSGILK